MRVLAYSLLIALSLTAPRLGAADAVVNLWDRSIPGPLGVNIHFTDPRPGEMEMLAEGGFRWVRMDFAWGGTEREKGQYDFSSYDRLLDSLKSHGIRALLILDYSNRFYDGGNSPSSDEGRAAFAKWAAAAADRYRGRDVVWEMYNEPNIGFWRPKPDAEQYIKLALAVGQALRRTAPNELYIGPATSTVDFEFLEKCFRAGLLEYWAAVSVHPYRQQVPETVERDYAKLRAMIDRYAPRGKRVPILSGEWGYSSAWSQISEEEQGKRLPRQWLTNLANDVPVSIWYDWHDDGADPKEPEHHFGTVRHEYRDAQRPVYEPKPAYLAAKTLAESLEGCRFSKRLGVDNADDYLMLYSGQDGERLVAWTTSKNERNANLQVLAGSFSVTGHTGDRLSEIEAGRDGLTIPVTDGPRYLRPKVRSELLWIASQWERAPREVSMKGPAETRVVLNLKNPLDRPIRVGTSSSSLDTVGPGATTQLSYSLKATRDPTPRSERLELVVEGLGRVAQSVALIVTNPFLIND